MSSNKKPSVCNRCYTNVNWNNEKRAQLNTKRPLNIEQTAVHECPKDGNGNIIINFENKALYDAAVSVGPNPATVQSLQPPKEYQQQQPQQGSQQLSQTDITQILAVMMNNMKEMAAQQKQFTDAVLRVENVMESQRKLLTEYIQYDPVGQQLNGLIETLLKYIPSPELRPKPASELLSTPPVKKALKSLRDIEKLEEDEYLAKRENMEHDD